MLFIALTAGLIIFGVLAVIGLALMLYFKLRGKEIIQPYQEMGQPYQEVDEGNTIEADYEIIDEEEHESKS